MSNVSFGQSSNNISHQTLPSNHVINGAWCYLSAVAPIAAVGVVALGIYKCMRSSVFSNFLIWMGIKNREIPIETTRDAVEVIGTELNNYRSILEDELEEDNKRNNYKNFEQMKLIRLGQHDSRATAVSSVKKAIQDYLNDKTINEFKVNFPKDTNKRYSDEEKTYQNRSKFFEATQASGEIWQFIDEMIRDRTPARLTSFGNSKFLDYYPAGRESGV